MLLNKKRVSQQNNLFFKLQSLSLDRRVCIFIFFMGIVGAIVGAIDSQIVMTKCLKNKNCLVSNSVEIRIRQVTKGACAGMVAASFLSLPPVISKKAK